MPFIKTISPESATGVVRRVFDAAMKRAGYIANIIRVMSLDGDLTQCSMQFYTKLMKSTNAISAAQREMLAAVVSNVNDCYY